MTVDILYEDNHLLVVVKPEGTLSQSNGTNAPDMLTELKAFITLRDKKPGNVFLGLVHRLDKEVGGVMVFAKTSKAAARLSKAIRERTVEKIYLAVTTGIPKEKEKTLIHYLKENEREKRVEAKTEGEGQFAQLSYRTRKTKGVYALLEIALHTGRKRQIRAQCAAMGTPLYGDARYGEKTNGAAIGLWAYRLAFPHPITNALLTFKKAPPKKAPWTFFAPFAY